MCPCGNGLKHNNFSVKIFLFSNFRYRLLPNVAKILIQILTLSPMDEKIYKQLKSINTNLTVIGVFVLIILIKLIF